MRRQGKLDRASKREEGRRNEDLTELHFQQVTSTEEIVRGTLQIGYDCECENIDTRLGF